MCKSVAAKLKGTRLRCRNGRWKCTRPWGTCPAAAGHHQQHLMRVVAMAMDGSDPKTFAKICNRTLRRADTPPRSRGGCPCLGDRWMWGGLCPTDRWERVAGGELGERLLGGGSLARVADRWSGVSAGVGFCVVLVIRYKLTDSGSISIRPRHVSNIWSYL